jgi:hypothetical protein
MRQVEGGKFCGSCGTKLVETVPQEPPLNEPARLQPSAPAISSKDSIQGDEILAQSNKAPDGSVSEVKVLDAGDKFVLSGAQPVEVDRILQKFLKRGAKLITPVSKVGNRWAAACTVPPATESMDETQTLSLLAMAKATDAKPAEPDDGCRVEEFGFKRIVYGPSRLAVQFRLEYMKHFGAEVVGEIEEQGEEWVAVMDMGDAKNTGYRW